jgi:pimeloyl-ACP methyl ester carboxylesterase
MRGDKMRYFNTEGIYYQYNMKRKLPWLRVTETVLTALLILAFLGFTYQMVFTEVDKGAYKPRGRMVDVGGYKVFTNSTGNGTVAIICESDIGSPFRQWDEIKERLSRNARIFTYERAGFGPSEKGTSPRDLEAAVKDLKTALRRTSTRAPYVLVGHGYGGMVMIKYAEQNPQDVAALILIDSWTEEYIKSPDFKKRLGREISKAQMYRYSSYFGLPRLVQQSGLLKEDQEFYQNLPEDAKGLHKSHIVTPKYNRALFEVWSSLKSDNQIPKLEGLMGEKPVYVFSSQGLGLAVESKWEEWQKELLKLSSNSELIEIQDSSTYIHKDSPDDVIHVLSTLIKKVGR